MNRPFLAVLALSIFGCSGYKRVPTDQGYSEGRVEIEPEVSRPEITVGPDETSDIYEQDDGLEVLVYDVETADDTTSQEVVGPEDVLEDLGPLTGKIRVVPALIDFGFWQGGVSVEIPFSVQNIGAGPLVVTKFWLAGDPSFSLLVGWDPKVLPDKIEYDIPDKVLKPGSSIDGKVKFSSIQAKEAHAEMRVFSSDPDYPDGYPVHILANKKVPCLKFTPDLLDFGVVMVQEHKDLEVRIDACGQLELVITAIEVPLQAQLAGFSLGFEKFPLGKPPSQSEPLTLVPGEKVTLRVRFAPEVPSAKDEAGIPIPQKYEIIVRDNTFTGSSFLPISGVAVDERCAKPVIVIEEGYAVKAGTLLHLSGVKSYSPFGSIITYRWSVQQPAGNYGSFMPSPSVAEPTFLLGVPGEYIFSLEVDDEAGSGTCEAAKAKVTAEADNIAIFVLTWVPETPFTPQPPFLGQDMDLHFLHPKAAGVDADGDGQPDGYYDIPWDCFWYNPSPNWDNMQPTQWFNDDPRLLYDSTDGLGPEVIVMGLQCPKGNRYRVGVHFFDDHGYGRAQARLQAYVLGNLAFDASTMLAPLDLWDAAIFECGPNTVTPIPGPSVKHNYKNPSFVVPQ